MPSLQSRHRRSVARQSALLPGAHTLQDPEPKRAALNIAPRTLPRCASTLDRVAPLPRRNEHPTPGPSLQTLAEQLLCYHGLRLSVRTTYQLMDVPVTLFNRALDLLEDLGLLDWTPAGLAVSPPVGQRRAQRDVRRKPRAG